MYQFAKSRVIYGVLGLFLAAALFAVVGYSGPTLAQETNTVQVGLTEFEIDMPTILPAGVTTFEITNNGEIVHNLQIEGEGVDAVLEANLQAGESGTLEVELPPGTYEVYCPVGNHAEQGMLLELTVTEPMQDEGMAEEEEESMAMAEEETEIYRQSPWWPYLSAHIDVESPPDLLGGPLQVQISQAAGGANWALPGPRQLDPTIFGSPDNPRGTELPPVILGVPAELRGTMADGTVVTNVPTPFGNEAASVNGTLELSLVDATATDGAITKDQIDLVATFEAPDGSGTYRVEVQQAAPHGWFIPTAGGVATNIMMHGITGWGSRLMPTQFAYASFWGMGDVYFNDELIAEGRLVHGMLTEYVRSENYELVWDNGVNPNARHFHLLVPPFTPKGAESPVPTGFQLPNGQEQPFLHVMFPNLAVETGQMEMGMEEGEEAMMAEEESSEMGMAEEESSEMGMAEEDVRVIEVAARNYEFDPATIEIKQGETVRFVVHSEDIYHTFTVKESEEATEDMFNLELYPDEGPVEYTFTPQEVGSLYLYCIPHEGLGMVGSIEVTQ